MALYVRDLQPQELQLLNRWMQGDDLELRHRAKVILLSHDGYRVPEISTAVDAHPTNLRKWIHRFNERGTRGLVSPRSGGPPPRFSEDQKQRIVALSQQRPRELGLQFNRWTLHRLAEQAVKRGIVGSISHEYIRQILKSAGTDYRRRRKLA